jgi:hypothetical protein
MTTKRNAKAQPQKPPTRGQIEKLKVHIEDITTSVAGHKKALTTIPETAKYVAVRVMQQSLIDKLGEELQRSQTKLKNLEETLDAEEKAEGQLEVAKTRQERIDFLEKSHPKCPQCGFPGDLVKGIRQPTIIGVGLGDINARVFMDYVCTNGNLFHGKHRFKLDIDRDLEETASAKKPRKTSKASKND